jgi:ankyrin repeat protein
MKKLSLVMAVSFMFFTSYADDVHDSIYNVPYSNIQYMNSGPDVDVEFNVIFNGTQDNLDVSIPYNSVSSNQNNPLIDATIQDNFKDVKSLLKNKNRNPNIQDINGRTALHYAAANDNARIANLLLQYGANPNIADHDGWMPLHVAADQNSFVVVQLLLNNKANPLLENNEGKIPFDCAHNDRIKGILLKR